MRSLIWISAKSLMNVQHEWDLAKIQWRDLMNQDPPAHCFFCFFWSCDVFMNIFPSEILWTISLIVKVVVFLSQQVKCSISLLHNITVNIHCHVRMGRWLSLANLVMSQWVDDVGIDTKQSYGQQPVSFTQDPGNPGSFTQDPGGRKTWIFTSKTGSNYT